MRITEVKRHPDGAEHRFDCELVLRRPHLVVALFEHPHGRSADGFDIPAGSRTHGFFWSRRPYSLYRIAGPDGALIAHRYDIVEDVRLGDREVSYLDLLLDIWVAPDGAVLVEDEDDVAAWRKAGLLSAEQVARIERAQALVLRRHRSIASEAARLLGLL